MQRAPLFYYFICHKTKLMLSAVQLLTMKISPGWKYYQQFEEAYFWAGRPREL